MRKAEHFLFQALSGVKTADEFHGFVVRAWVELEKAH
jgi:hypothetical protein